MSQPLPNADRPLKILFTEGSSTSARQALYSLGPRHTIDILDPSPFCQCRFSRFVRRWYRCPSFSRQPQQYLEFLIERLRDGDYDVLLPTHEQVFLLARFQQELQELAGLALPGFDQLDQMMNKARFVRLLQELDLPQPEAVVVQGPQGLRDVHDFPCFVKVDYGTAGEGVRLVKNVEQLEAFSEHLVRSGSLDAKTHVVVQKPAVGEKGAILAVFNHGQLVAAHGCRTREFGVGGSSSAIRSAWDPQAAEHLSRLGQHLNWHGAMAVEYFADDATGGVQYIECNPRIGETFNATLSGVNLCEALMQISLGQDPPRLPPGRENVRTHQGFLTLTAKALDGAHRRQLLAELLRWIRGQAQYADSSDDLTRPREDWLSLIPAAAVTLLLLVRPRAAQWLVTKTVRNYSLHQDAASKMRDFSLPQ